MILRIAMWSGPRNISTALMRSWENRPDCSVVDEPFYAAYLSATGLDHPCRDSIIAAQNSDYQQVIEQLTRGKVSTELQYQKHMTHHIPDDMNMAWCQDLRHCFLIRDPAQVIASYLQKMPSVDEQAIGIRRQAELFEQISLATGTPPEVIDSNDVLKNPGKILGELCDRLQIDFPEQAMLSWPPGKRCSDGVWADHWYHNVEHSSGFARYTEKSPELQGEHRALAEEMRGYYQRLSAVRIRP